jgi:hypothetical protein
MASALLFTAVVGVANAAPTAATVFIDNFMSMPAPAAAPAAAHHTRDQPPSTAARVEWKKRMRQREPS